MFPTNGFLYGVRMPIVLDGYGVAFDPAKHLVYTLAARGDTAFIPPPPSEPLYETDKSRPAGWWDKNYDKENR